jgi:hypothetical protein
MLILQAGNGQVDTLALRARVKSINTEREHVEFWDYIFERDQNSAQRISIASMDEENLISVSYYFNAFGYPDFEVLGNKSTIINMVWQHTASSQAKKLTFPIILQGYLKKAISEETFRTYFVRSLYHGSCVDKPYVKEPVSDFLKPLNVNVSSQISIHSILMEMDSLRRHLSCSKEIVGTWQSQTVMDTNYLHGKQLISKHEGAKVQIYKHADGHFYFTNMYSRDICQPDRLTYDPIKDIYELDGFKANRYYQINNEGNLHRRDDKKIYLTYYSITD